MRLIVHRRARRQGLGRALMLAIEEHARRLGRTTLVLDTRHGDPSEHLYQSLGWALAGTIPRYARSAGGTLDATAIYYRLLDPA
jgi:ribosomal protein S18 acetylase RimI-like enzyme